MNLKDRLEDVLNEEERADLVRSYDMVGDIAIIEIPPSLKKKEKAIAKAVLQTHPYIKSVFKKKSGRRGEFRLRDLERIAGNGSETLHKEYGCLFKTDVMKAYFSPREATERMRIARQVKPGERVLVMFAGIGCYPVVISRFQPRVEKVYGIEINPHAVRYMEENIRLNRQKYVIIPIKGDVKVKARPLYGRCDRVVMPLPGEGQKYLRQAVQCVKNNGMVHFYTIGSRAKKDQFEDAINLIQKACRELRRKCEIRRKVNVLPYGPGLWKICVDFAVKKR